MNFKSKFNPFLFVVIIVVLFLQLNACKIKSGDKKGGDIIVEPGSLKVLFLGASYISGHNVVGTFKEFAEERG